MKYLKAAKLVASMVGLAMWGGAAFAQAGATDFGKAEYDANCAVCHGTSAKGNGPYVDMLRRDPTDLTTLAKRNSGVLPVKRLYETIEGADVPSHGSRAMPIWGNAFRAESHRYVSGASPDPEVSVRGRILTLIDYINRIQVY